MVLLPSYRASILDFLQNSSSNHCSVFCAMRDRLVFCLLELLHSMKIMSQVHIMLVLVGGFTANHNMRYGCHRHHRN